MSRRLLVTACVVLPLAAALLAGCSSTTKVVTAGPQSDTVTVTGTGQALSKPDRATVGFGVSVTNADPRAALQQASTTAAKVNAALKKAGIADQDLQTGSVNLNPQYTYPPGGPQKLTGYQASIQVSARTKNIDKVGDVIVAGTQAGANNVSGITFDLDPSNPARYDASANAVKDAQARAAAVAKAAGRQLGAVISIGQPQEVNPSALLRSAAIGYSFAASPVSVPVQPGQLTAGESVTVVFALK